MKLGLESEARLMSIDPTSGAAGSKMLVTSALKSAGQSTGVSFDFLLKMAKRESSLNPLAQAKTSSAAGLFQFIEQTWLGAVKTHGAKHGLGEFAADITRSANGKYSVADETRREEILNLRFDAKAASALAGELANDNKRALEAKLGRGVSNAELYAAHFLGASGAAKLLTADENANAAALLPRAAAANKPVFYDGARARSVGEVMASIALSMGEVRPDGRAAPETKSMTPVLEDAPAPLMPMALRLREGLSLAAMEPGPPLRDVAVGLPSRPAAQPDAPVELTRFAANEPAPLPNAQLSDMALRVLQALDPTRLMASRDDGRRT